MPRFARGAGCILVLLCEDEMTFVSSYHATMLIALVLLVRVSQLYKFLKNADSETEIAYAMELPGPVAQIIKHIKDQYAFAADFKKF